tara:strand:- start:1046 stop:1624 length:579 start_codon:yes stop_codon:yes gene_type:complete
MYQKYLKRFFDIIFSFLLILFLSPIMILIFVSVWIFIGFPIFTQKRPGLDNKIFIMYKFRSLYDSNGKTSESKRQNKLGNFLRKTGLDELPQLYNVLKNDMSLIGPRPLLSEYLKKYSNYEKQRHMVKPGITGLAQINPEISGMKSWVKSIKFDIHYAKNVSFKLDVKIIFHTIILILFHKKQHKDFNKTFN